MKEAAVVSPILTKLRSATRAHHDRLESLTFGPQIVDGSLRPDQYERLIRWQTAAHRVLEPGVAGFSDGNYRYRCRFPADPTQVSAPCDRATALGRIYVLDGASLGATVILRHLRTNDALLAYRPFSFYRQQAEFGLKQWRSYLTLLADTHLRPEELDRARQSAVAAFESFREAWETSL